MRWASTGYSGTGSAPSGSGTSYPAFTITQDSTLRWNWLAQYLVTPSAGPNGLINPSSASWQDAGVTLTFTATPTATSFVVDRWIVNGVNVQYGGNTFTLNNLGGPSEVLVAFRSTDPSQPPTIVNACPLPCGSIGRDYSHTLLPSGGVSPYTWTNISGTLPPGLVLDPGSGIISGTPTKTNSYSFTLRVTGGNGLFSDKPCSLAINAGPPTITTPCPLPSGAVGIAYSLTNQATGGAKPYTWSLAVGSLPPGLTLATNTGVIVGTPTSINTFNFTLRCTGGDGLSSDRICSVVVHPQPQVATPTITPNGGSFFNSVNVKVECATPGATIYVCEQSAVNPVCVWSPYTGPITLRHSATLQAKAVLSGYVDSEIGLADFTVTDNVPPTFLIASPRPGLETNNATLLVSGTATDNVQVKEVRCQVNSGPWFVANGTANWQAPVQLQAGLNTIRAYAVDTTGNSSVTNSITVTYVVTAPLVLEINGSGTVTPNYNGQLLRIGSNYTVRAQTRAGWAFTNWTSNLLPTSTVNPLTFTMQSNLVLTANFVDVVKPTISITYPSANSPWKDPVLVLQGTATDNSIVAKVEFQLNDSPFQLASGTTNWSATIILSAGTNILRVRSIDGYANQSPVATRTLVHTVTSPLTLAVNGNGRVTGATNGQRLEVGRAYKLTASTALRHLFAGWSGDISSTNPVLNFLMQSNLTLQANFVTNPFVALKGTFYGLFYETNQTRNQDHSGNFTFTLAEAGTYSARFQLGAKRLAATGKFDWMGSSIVTFRPSPGNAVTVTLQLDVANQTAWVAGSVGDGNWLASLAGYRAPIYAGTNASPFAGRYTLVVPGSDDAATSPGGDGYGALTVSKAGRLVMSGSLADGTAVSQAILLSSDGQWPLYLSLNSAKGSLLGWISFASQGSGDCSGLLSWIKPAMPTARYYPLGFTNEHEAVGSKFVWLGTTNRLLNFTEGVAEFDLGNLAQGFENTLSLRPNNTLLVTGGATNRLVMSLSTANGLMSGSFLHPDTKRSIILKGVVLQSQNAGFGYFLGTNQSGFIYLGPAAP
jgi:hypothetical protein